MKLCLDEQKLNICQVNRECSFEHAAPYFNTEQ